MAKKKPQPPPATSTNEKLSVTVRSPIYESFRVAQLSGMFDVPLQAESIENFEVELPPDDDAWQIGVIVGPSGSGKSTVSGYRWPANIYRGREWPSDRAVIDCFGERSVKEITTMLSAVGFSSPPNWLRPYAVLSNGEKFRCDLAYSLLNSEFGMRKKKITLRIPKSALRILLWCSMNSPRWSIVPWPRSAALP
jgi:hypothetical protein